MKTRACCPIRAVSFEGYRLLHEFFAFPEKFFFLDLTGLESALHGFKDGRADFSDCAF